MGPTGMLYSLFLLLTVIPVVFCDGQWFGRSLPVNLTGEGFPVKSLGQCALLCEGKDGCKLAEYHSNEETCVTSSRSDIGLPLHIDLNEPGLNVSVNWEDENKVLIYSLDPADAAARPAHCAAILSMDPETPSGVYFIWPDNVTKSRVWCDMDTDSGGWTNVYSYTTLNAVLSSRGNAVNPRPTWPVTNAVPSSTTPPSDLQQYGALDFQLWINIGEEFMIKSNVNNWIACTPGTGSFSKWIAGSINCRMIKSITTICPDLPNVALTFKVSEVGPDIRGSSHYYYFRSATGGTWWPTHDPCGVGGKNHLQGIQAEGQIWLR